MNLKRSGALLGVVAVGAMTLAACGSDNNSSSTGVDASASNATCEGKSNLSAAGSSAQKNAMDQFVATYISVCQEKGKTVNVAYNPSGSGDGRTQFIAGQIDFAGSDSAIKDEQADKAKERCVGGEAWNLPLVFGPIAALNSGASLPDEKITTVIRSDSSGTTDNFQKYLDAASNGAWTSGAGSDFTGGVGEGAKGSAGVAQAVATAPGSITYVEKSFADQNKLSVAEINTGSEAVALTNDTAAKSIAGAKFKSDATGDLTLDLASIFKTNEAGAYPLVLATYSIVCSKGYDADTSAAVKSFLTSAANEGQANLAEQGYVPLPSNVQDRLNASITAIS